MKIKVGWIGKTKDSAIQALTDEYLKRISRYAEVAGPVLKDEAAVLAMARGERQKERHKLILLDSRGRQLSSEELARWLEGEQAYSVPLLFAVGSADGFSDELTAVVVLAWLTIWVSAVAVLTLKLASPL